MSRGVSETSRCNRETTRNRYGPCGNEFQDTGTPVRRRPIGVVREGGEEVLDEFRGNDSDGRD